MADRSTVAKSIFYRVIELEPKARVAYLDQSCASYDYLRQEVETLLRFHDDSDTFLESPVVRHAEFAGESDGAASGKNTDDVERNNVDLEFLQPCEKPDRIGLLDYYEIIEVIGRGGMGVVLRGLDTKLHRIVAIKVLAPELAANAVARNRFEREARAVAAVSHDHIVTIFAVDEFGKLPYLVMECIVGRSLQEAIDEAGSLEVTRVLRIGTQIASGLAAAHAQGLVHRDIKPANILLENSVERVKITDFGLARAVDDVSVTKTGETAGTPQYMSPEQAEGKRVDHRSDLFSLGSVLYAMCAGRPAFRGESSLAVLRRVCDDVPRPICEVNPDVPPWLAGIIDKLLAKNPDERFQTAAEVSELLEEHLAQLQSLLSADDSQPLAGMATEAAPPRSRRVGLAITIVLLIAVAGVALTESAGITRFSGLFVSAAREEPTQDAAETADDNRNDGKRQIPRKPSEDHGPTPFKANNVKTTDENQPSSYEILTSDDWEWTEPESLGSNVNSEHVEGGPHLSTDGLTLLFHSKRPVGQPETIKKDFDLWMSRRKSIDDPFDSAENLDATINSGSDEKYPTMSADGLTLVFGSRRQGGAGAFDLWMSTRSSNKDDWSPPVNLGPKINGKMSEIFPYLSPDGLKLWYTRLISQGGEWSLRMSQRSSGSLSWTNPITLESGVGVGRDPNVVVSITLSGAGLFRMYNNRGPRMDVRATTESPWKSIVVPGKLKHPGTGYNRYPSLSADGRILVYTSPLGKDDLWMTHRVKKQ